MKKIFGNLALTFLSVAFTLSVCEVGFRLIPATQQDNAQIVKMEGGYSSGKYFSPHKELGYSPAKDIVVTSKKIMNDEVVYDATYSINQHGLRDVGPLNNKPLFLFFGGSFTFGEGINDDETLPYLFSKALHDQYDILNFGFHGYGPHQMLRALETEMPKQISKAPVKSIIFQTSSFHIMRSAGLSPWDKSGPKYTLTQDNSIKYNGPFTNKYIAKIKQQLTNRSKFAAYLLGKTDMAIQPNAEAMIDLYIGILKHVKQLSETQYQTPFIILFWDDVFKLNDIDITPNILEQLERHHFTFVKTSQVFKSLSKAEKEQLLIKLDGHPNSRANTLNAQALVSILKKNRVLSSQS